jgi:hypothetical protein|tara:strand:- start:881 stop:1414 length:534 start_codon:yes stop_codon:yes gene_type:complete
MAYRDSIGCGHDTNKGRHRKVDMEIVSAIDKLFGFGFLTKENLGDKTKYQIWMFPEDLPMNTDSEGTKAWVKQNPAKVIYEKVSKIDDYENLFFVPKFKFKNKQEYMAAGYLENWQITPTTIENFDEFDIKMSRDSDCYFNNSKSFDVLVKESVEFYLGDEISKRFIHRVIPSFRQG